MRLSVSVDTSTANHASPSAVAVRQQPEQAIEAPRTAGAPACRKPGGVLITSRMSAPSPIARRSLTLPRPLTMPVNIHALPKLLTMSSPTTCVCCRTKRGIAATVSIPSDCTAG